MVIFSKGKAEFFPTHTLVELSYLADSVVSARFLKEENGNHFFLIHSLNENTEFDTLQVEGLARLFNLTTSSSKHVSPKSNVEFSNCDQLVIYLSRLPGNTLIPVWSGFRLMKNGSIYLPVQKMNPGKFSFVRSSLGLTWAELLSRVDSIQRRFEPINRIRKIKDPQQRNEALFDWMKVHKNSFGKDCGLDENCGWGNLEWEIFEWITEGNIAEDTWKASQLYRAVNASSEIKWRRNAIFLKDKNGNSFQSFEDIDFLINVANSPDYTLTERSQALSYLKAASRIVYPYNYPIPDSSMLALQVEKQLTIREQLLPLLDHQQLREGAFEVIKGMSNPRDGSLRNRIDLEILPLVKSYYFEVEPGSFKSELAKFLVHNVSAEEWKEISGCDAKIFVDLYSLSLDTATNELTFGINYNYGSVEIQAPPEMHVQGEKNHRIQLEKSLDDFPLPYRNWQGVRYVKINVQDLPEGNYKVYVSGTAGDENQFEWKSESGVFRKR